MSSMLCMPFKLVLGTPSTLRYCSLELIASGAAKCLIVSSVDPPAVDDLVVGIP